MYEFYIMLTMYFLKFCNSSGYLGKIDPSIFFSSSHQLKNYMFTNEEMKKVTKKIETSGFMISD